MTRHRVPGRRGAAPTRPTTSSSVIVSSAVIGVPVYSYYRDSKRVQEKIDHVAPGSALVFVSSDPGLRRSGDYRHTAPLPAPLWSRAEGHHTGCFHEGLSKINPVHIDDVIADVLEALLQLRAPRRLRLTVWEIAGPEGHGLQRLHRFDDCQRPWAARSSGATSRGSWVERAILVKGLFKDVTKERRACGLLLVAPRPRHLARAASSWVGSHVTYAEGIKDVAARATGGAANPTSNGDQ